MKNFYLKILFPLFLSSIFISLSAQTEKITSYSCTPVTISCNVSISGDSLILEFINKSNSNISFYLGTGMPEYYIKYNPFTIGANFTCQLDYVHDCFHFQKIKIASKKKKIIKFLINDDRLREYIGNKKIKSKYRTFK